ncbi:rod shape-determining protein MreC [Bacteroidota bacterium]
MRNLITYIIRYHFSILFLIIEVLSIIIVIQYNQFQNSKFYNFSHAVSGAIYKKTYNIKEYMNLRPINNELLAENERLKNELELKKTINLNVTDSLIDTTVIPQYKYIQAKVVNNSTNKRFNYITINKGSNHEIEPEMAVVSNSKLVGVINNVSNKYASVISILNPKLRISAKIKKNEYFGSLYWEGKNVSTCVLSEIPHHVEIEKGDTIITSGHSSIFPEGILIGFVSDYEIKEGNFFHIKVKLAHDLKSITNVMVIKNYNKEEQKKLESYNYND